MNGNLITRTVLVVVVAAALLFVAQNLIQNVDATHPGTAEKDGPGSSVWHTWVSTLCSNSTALAMRDMVDAPSHLLDTDAVGSQASLC